MTTIRPLSKTYAEARKAFLDAAIVAGATLTEFPHDLKGPDGEDLAIDVAEFGPADAESVLVVVSATHGVEGFAGSAMQLRWLEEHTADRPADVRVVLVHAFNPYGFAWVRRVNEDNVDLNRNFIDWGNPIPQNPGYMELADLIVPSSWTEDEQARTLGLLLEYLNEHGLPKLQAVVSGGQYEEPNGVFYGGTGPVLSHRWLQEWVKTDLSSAKQVAILDLHTGLGEWGTAQLLGGAAPGSELYQRTSDWFGDVVSVGGDGSVSSELLGDWIASIEKIIPHAQLTAIAIEYGTIDTISVLQALRADAWLHGYGDPSGSEAPAIKAQVRAAFADDDPKWVESIWGPFATCMTQALTNLSQETL